MSVLDDFVRMRLFRKRAAEFEWLADTALVPSVRRRYRTIARHYMELADREEQSDKARMAKRLERLKLQRQEAAAQTASPAGSEWHQLSQPQSSSTRVLGRRTQFCIGRKSRRNRGEGGWAHCAKRAGTTSPLAQAEG
jgi:hypothetical protein